MKHKSKSKEEWNLYFMRYRKPGVGVVTDWIRASNLDKAQAVAHHFCDRTMGARLIKVYDPVVADESLLDTVARELEALYPLKSVRTVMQEVKSDLIAPEEALVIEKESGKPRASLVQWLEQRMSAA